MSSLERNISLSMLAGKVKGSHSGPENLKKSSPRKLKKSNKLISRKIFFDQIPFFAISKMAKNQFLNSENV